jgi:hypothetical protein
MAGAMSIPLLCPKCGLGATLFVTPWTPDEPRRPQTWSCPHCRESIAAELPGKVAWVLARQNPG